MVNGPLLPEQFVATEFSSPTEKAGFGNSLLRFLEEDCPMTLFTGKLYKRLSMTFGNIAHYDLHGFYGTWFSRDRHKAEFVRKTLRWPCHGDPKFTYSDVEGEVQRVVRARNYLALYELKAEQALRGAEMQELERLQAKYGAPAIHTVVLTPATPQTSPDELANTAARPEPLQGTLF